MKLFLLLAVCLAPVNAWFYYYYYSYYYYYYGTDPCVDCYYPGCPDYDATYEACIEGCPTLSECASAQWYGLT